MGWLGTPRVEGARVSQSKGKLSNTVATRYVALEHLKCGLSKIRPIGSVKYIPDFKD